MVFLITSAGEKESGEIHMAYHCLILEITLITSRHFVGWVWSHGPFQLKGHCNVQFSMCLEKRQLDIGEHCFKDGDTELREVYFPTFAQLILNRTGVQMSLISEISVALLLVSHY